jgi:formamidopyrimidine-DNA glycosylase
MLLAPSRAIVAALQGARIGEARRIGKWLFLRAGREAWLVLHFGMTGDVEAFDGEPPRHSRLALRFRGGGGVAFTDPRRFGKIGLATSPEDFAGEHDLGPDALDLPQRDFLRRLAGRRGAIKAALLDQSVVAGVGNLWADESLWRAKIHPATPVGEADLKALHRAMIATLRAGVKRGWGPVPKSWLYAARERSGTCPRCGTRLAVATIAGRTTYWCPEEQRRR